MRLNGRMDDHFADLVFGHKFVQVQDQDAKTQGPRWKCALQLRQTGVPTGILQVRKDSIAVFILNFFRTLIGETSRRAPYRPESSRRISALEGRLGSSTFRAHSTPATGRLAASIKPSCTSTEA